MAWLHAVPEGKKIARFKQIKEPTMPPVMAAYYMIEYLIDLGLADIGWPDIKAWNELTDQQLKPWEASLLFNMSQAYTTQLALSRDKSAIAPFVIAENPDISRKKVDDFFRKLPAITG